MTKFDNVCSMVSPYLSKERVLVVVTANPLNTALCYVEDCRANFNKLDINELSGFLHSVELSDDRVLKRYASKALISLNILLNTRSDDKMFCTAYDRVLDKLGKINKLLRKGYATIGCRNQIDVSMECNKHYFSFYRVPYCYDVIRFYKANLI